MDTLTVEMMAELGRPFHPSRLSFKPGTVNSQGNRALALAYADLRAYQERLDEVCGPNWAVTYSPWGDKRLICHLTVAGVTRSSTGEMDAQSDRNEIGGTSAEAQAFKRACAMFGLGRYLYALPSLWVEYDPQRRKFTGPGRQRLEKMAFDNYRRWMSRNGQADSPEAERDPNGWTVPGNAQEEAGEERAGFTQDQDAAQNGQNGGQTAPDGAGAQYTPQPKDAELFARFTALGEELYQEKWAEVAVNNTARITDGRTDKPAQLNTQELQRLVRGLAKLKAQRDAQIAAMMNGTAA
jgi:hypothetical protein